MDFLIASTNSFKVNALKNAWQIDSLDDSAALVTFEDLHIKNDLVVEEDTGTIGGDALKKASIYSQFYKRPVIAMDQGFGFSALNGWPGAATKSVMAGSDDRILGDFNDDENVQLNDIERAKLVLSQLSENDRSMTCFYAVAISIPGKEPVLGLHQVHGLAAENVQTGNGWFYDWFFIPEGYETPFSLFDSLDFEEFGREKMYRIPEEIISFVERL